MDAERERVADDVVDEVRLKVRLENVVYNYNL